MNENTQDLTSPVPTKKTVSILLRSSGGDCETCGSYETLDIDITVDGVTKTIGADTHLGGSFDCMDIGSTLKAVLEQLGIDAEVDSEYIPWERTDYNDAYYYSDDIGYTAEDE